LKPLERPLLSAGDSQVLAAKDDLVRFHLFGRGWQPLSNHNRPPRNPHRYRKWPRARSRDHQI